MLIIFDCDGVLVDSEPLALRLMAEHLSAAGFEASAEELLSRFAGFTDDEVLKTVAREAGKPLPDGFEDAYVEALDERLARVEAVPGAQEVLDRLDDPRCVCSNSPTSRLKISLGATGLYDRFRPYVFSARDVAGGRPKPAPDVYLHAAQQLETAPGDTVVIEDSVAGVTGAHAAGMRVIGFTGTAHGRLGLGDALTEAGAETVVHRLADVVPVIDAFRHWRNPG